MSPAGFKLSPIDFEKEDDTNFHMDMNAVLANMRSCNCFQRYHI